MVFRQMCLRLNSSKHTDFFAMQNPELQTREHPWMCRAVTIKHSCNAAIPGQRRKLSGLVQAKLQGMYRNKCRCHNDMTSHMAHAGQRLCADVVALATGSVMWPSLKTARIPFGHLLTVGTVSPKNQI